MVGGEQTMRPWQRHLAHFAWATTLAACAAPEPARPAPPPPAPPSAKPAAQPPAPPWTDPTKPPTPAGGDEGTESGAEEEAPNKYAGAIDGIAPLDGAVAPCDFDRTYRGKIGEAGVSWALRRKGQALEGWAAYDAGAGALELRGRVEPNGTITVTEHDGDRQGGRATATCDPATGALQGDFLPGNGRTLRLAPRPRGTTPIVEKRKQIGKLSEDEPSCTWDVRNPAVFGLGDPGREGRINVALKMRFHDEAALEKQVAQCASQVGGRTDNHATGWYSIESDESGVLSVLRNGYLYFGPAVHGEWNAGADAISIDVPTGRRLALNDVVTSSAALRPILSSCIAFGTRRLSEWNDFELERNLHGLPADEGEPSTVHDPKFLVLPDGLAVLLTNLPTVAAWDELQGLVIRWGALKRDGVLAPKSPIARVWSAIPALAAGEPACERAFAPRWMPRDVRDRARKDAR